jgi:hypothetical protein
MILRHLDVFFVVEISSKVSQNVIKLINRSLKLKKFLIF